MKSETLLELKIYFFPAMRDQPGSAHIPIIIGTYAKMLRKGSNDSDLNLFQWTVLIHLDERPRCDLSHYLERVDFTLHKSFANVCNSRILSLI